MKRLLLVALGLALLVRPALAGPCSDCTATKLCEKHAAADKDAAKEFRSAIANPDVAVRVAAIENFATACAEHSNCRPAANAGLLATALKDPDGSVRAKAAEKLGEQDPKTAGPILTPEAEALVKKLAKEPHGENEDKEWLANFDYVKGICAGLAAMGTAEAGPAMARVMASQRLKVLTAASEYFPKVRAKEVPPAVIAAIDHVRYTPPGADRDSTWVALLKAWESLTQSHVKSPDPTNAADAIRYVNECKSWWKANEKTWK